MKKFLLAVTLALTLCIQAAPVFAQETDDEWEFSIDPYVWLPTITADLEFKSVPAGSSGTPQLDVNLDPDDLLDSLDAIAFLSSELRKGKWSLFSDFIYVKLSGATSKVKAINFGGNLVTTSLDLGTEIEIKGSTTTVVGGYEILNKKYVTANLIGGVRYLWIEADVDWNLSATVTGPRGGQTFSRAGSLTEDGDVWNGVGGVRGKVLLGDSNWFIPYYADVGAGDCELTWQVSSGLAYAFERWDIGIGYRHLVFEGDDDALIDNLTLSGPYLGASIRF